MKFMTKRQLRLISLIFAVMIGLSAFSGCGKAPGNPSGTSSGTTGTVTSPQNAKAPTGTSIHVTDQVGRTVTLDKPAKKIVSSYYISSALLIALGLEDKVVGLEMKADSRELYKKAAPGFLKLPAVGSGKGINIEETATLKPDIVILPKKLKDAVPQLEALKIPVLVVDPETMDNFMACISLLGRIGGAEARAAELASYYKGKMDFVKSMTKDLKSKPSVYLAGSSYLTTCTSQMYQNDLIQMAGGTNVSMGLKDSYWAQISPEQLVAWNPEYFLAVSYAEYKLDDIRKDGKLKEISAVKNNKLFTFPSTLEPWDYPTPSSVLGVLWLLHQLHPELYPEKAYVDEATSFYKKFFDIEVTRGDLGLLG